MKDQNKPLITIITLNYNSNYLFDTINSVLAQKYPNIEYIIIDDGSKNFDKSLVKKYINNNNKGNIANTVIISSKTNAGTVKETNKANKLAKGKIIFNLSSDDIFIDEDVIEDWVNHFAETGCDISTGLREVCDEKMHKVIKILPNKKDINAIKNYSNEKLFKYCEKYNIIFGCCTAKTKKCLDTVGPINETYKLIEDYPFLMMSLRKNQKISWLNRKVVKYRSGGSSATINLNKQYLNDSDNIFRNEIEPYSQNKKNAYRKYVSWKKSALVGQKYYNIERNYTHSEISFLKMLKSKMFLALSHPFIIAKKILNKVLRYK